MRAPVDATGNAFTVKRIKRKMTSAGPSHYAVLGLDRSFTPAQLRKRYRALALRWHPDRNRGSEAAATEKFKEVHQAFEVLSDPQLRRQYDAELALARARGACATPRSTPSTAGGPPPPPPPRRPPPPKDTRSKGAWEEALRSDEFLRRTRERRAKEEATAETQGDHEDDADAAADDSDDLDEEEALEIAEALAAVEEAMRREQEEVEAAVRAVERAEQSPRGGSTEAALTAELQLKALMELGFHAEVALPLCDGVSSIEELVEVLMDNA